MVDYQSPKVTLSPETMDKVRKMRRYLNDLNSEINRVEPCLGDCSSYRALNEQLSDFFRRIEETFGQHPTIPGQ